MLDTRKMTKRQVVSLYIALIITATIKLGFLFHGMMDEFTIAAIAFCVILCIFLRLIHHIGKGHRIR